MRNAFTKLLKSIKTRLEIKRYWKEAIKVKEKSGQIVMADLANFCRADITEGCGTPIDTARMALNAGRRQVYEFILARLEITEADIEDIIYGEQNNDHTNTKY